MRLLELHLTSRLTQVYAFLTKINTMKQFIKETIMLFLIAFSATVTVCSIIYFLLYLIGYEVHN